MTTASIQVPIFDGSESADAEDFVLAVRQKAYAEGRQRDNAWILDLVSASLARDALRWHAALDPAIQNDWMLLQKALLGRFCETFKGIDGVECERFIISIRRRTFEEGKVGDNEWITQFIASCVADDALRWHASLAPEIQEDWKLLQAAMLDRYPPPDIRERPLKRALVPTPASAAPASRKGAVRFVDPGNPGLKTYLSRTCLSGYIVVTQDQSEALAVECSYGGSSNTIGVKNLSLGGYDLMGIRWQYAGVPTLSATSTHFARLLGLSGPLSDPTTMSWPGGKGTVHADVWDIAADGTVKMFYTDWNGVKVTLVPRRATNMSTDVIIAGEASARDSSYTPGAFVFEAM